MDRQEKFNLSEAALLVSKKDTLSKTERKNVIFTELDNAIKSGISTGQFDMSVGLFSVFANKNSILSSITDSDIQEYNESRDWNIEIERMVNINISIPTYKYILDFGTQNQFKELICIVDKKDVIVGNLSSDGNIALDVSKIFMTKGLIAHNFDKFVFKIDNKKYSLDRKDTKGDYTKVNVQLM